MGLICAVSRLLNVLFKMKIQRIFIVRSDRFGEFLLSLPAIKLIKTQFPESTVYLFAQGSNIELIRGIEFVDRFIEYREDNFSGFKGVFRLAAILRKERIDCLLALNPKKEFHLAAYLAGVPLRVGYGRKWGWCLNRKIKDKKHLADKHEAEYNIELTSLICQDSFIPEIDLPVDKKSSLEALNISGSYLLLHPFTSDRSKKIDISFWQALVKKLKEKDFKDIALIGSKLEDIEAWKLAQELGVANFVGKLSLRNLAAVMKYNCQAFIGLDSGPMQLASLLKVPVVALFKASNPKRWGPRQTNCLIFELKSEQDFSNQVAEAVNFILKQ